MVIFIFAFFKKYTRIILQTIRVVPISQNSRILQKKCGSLNFKIAAVSVSNFEWFFKLNFAVVLSHDYGIFRKNVDNL